MNERIETLSDSLASKLALREEAVKKWVIANKYTIEQLEVINKQVENDEIQISILVDSIINNTNYRILID